MRNELRINVDTTSLNYNDSGKQTLPIIFVHGFPFDKSTWDPQFDFLKETHRVIIYDLPGFGQSTPLKTEVSIDSLSDNLIDFMDALKIKKAIVCGLSMGGYIVLNAVERFPERFQAIILSDTQCAADSKENAEKRLDTVKEIENKGLNEFTETFLKKTFSVHAQNNRKQTIERIRKVILSNSPESITSALKAMAARKETCASLKTILVPTLILCGAEDVLTPVALSEFLFNTIPNSEMHIIKNAGHLSNLEQSETFNDHLHSFISDIIL